MGSEKQQSEDSNLLMAGMDPVIVLNRIAELCMNSASKQNNKGRIKRE